MTRDHINYNNYHSLSPWQLKYSLRRMTLSLGKGGTQLLILLKPGKLNDYAWKDKDLTSQEMQNQVQAYFYLSFINNDSIVLRAIRWWLFFLFLVDSAPNPFDDIL